MYDLRTGFSIELADITEQTFVECKQNGIYSIDPGLSKRFSTDAYAKMLTIVRKMADRYGICIECIHLPYGSGWDISETFEPLRKAAVEGHKEIMRVCREVCPPNYFVLHPIFKSRYTAYCFGQLQLSIVRKTYQTSGFQ